MTENSLKKVRFIHKCIFGTSVIVISSCYFYKYLCEKKPELIKKKIFNRYFDKKHKDLIANRQYALRLNAVPAVDNHISKTTHLYKDKYDLTRTIKGKKFSHPIGLGCGIDIDGRGLRNLDKLGFSFIEFGIISDQDETSKRNLDFSTNENSFKIKNEEKVCYNLFESYYQIQIMNTIKKKKPISSYLGANVKLSETLLSSVPYLCDSKLSKLVGEIYPIVDFLTLNLSVFRSVGQEQYQNLEKFQVLLNKLKKEIYREIGIKEAIKYEKSERFKKSKDISFINCFNFKNVVIKDSYPLIFLKLDPSNEKNLKRIIDLSIDSGIIDALLIDGALRVNNNLIVGEESNENALNQLRRTRELTQGKIKLISSGGILTGKDVFERIKEGATLVNIYSAFLKEGPFIVEKLLEELSECMEKEKLTNLNDL